MANLTAKALREERHKLVQATRAKTLDKAEAEKRAMTAEEDAEFNRVFGHVDGEGKAHLGVVDEMKAKIDQYEKVEILDSEFSARVERNADLGRGDYRPPMNNDGAVATDEHRSLAIQAWLRANNDHALTEQHEEACKLVGINPRSKRMQMSLWPTERTEGLRRSIQGLRPERWKAAANEFLAANMGSTGTAGGYLIPPETLIRELEVNMLWFGGMAQVAEMMTTATGERMSWPTADDTGNTGVQLGESVTIGSSVAPTFTKVYWDAYKLSSQAVLVPYELLEDAVVNLPRVLGEMLGVRLGRVRNTKYTVGTGAATAKGIVTAASSFSAASATAIAADDVWGVIHSIDPAYRTGDCGFMLHDTILLTLRKLKDGVGRYLWQNGMENGVPDRLGGYGLTVNNDMDSTISSGKKTILFGQLFKYKIRRVNGIRFYRLEERYRDNDQDGFIAMLREDGNLLTAGTAPVKYLAH